jgi:epoxyqueuosine reductase
MNAAVIKTIIRKMGADLCGVAPVERFKDAPKGFHPTDIYHDCQSVVVFAKRLPVGALAASSCVPYTYVNSMIMQEVDRLTLKIARKLEDLGIQNVPIPTDDPYEYWEPDRSYGRAILSMRHAGFLAGLGVLGKNTLLINADYGNMIQLGAVLINAELEGDSLARYIGCPTNCELCITACPQNALDGVTVNQQLCRPLSNFQNEKGYILKKCNICRKVCPHALGIKNL